MSAQVKSLSVAAESSFGSLDPTTGLPDVSGLTFYGAEFELASADFGGLEAPMTENNDGREGFYHRPPEPETVWSGGSRVRRLTGTVTVRANLRTAGSQTTGVSRYQQVPLAMMIASGMGYHDPGAQFLMVTGAVSATQFTVGAGDYASAVVGEMLAAEIAGRREFSGVTGKSGGNTIHHSPAFSTGLGVYAVPRLCRVFYVTTSQTALGPSLALTIDGDGWRAVATGCRMESLALSYDGRKVVCEMTIRCALAQTDHLNATLAAPTYEAGELAHALGAYTVISDAVTGAAPLELARNTVGVDEFSASFTNTLSPLNHSDDIIGFSDYRVSNQTSEVSLTLSRPSTLVEDDFFDQTARSVLVGWGPVGVGNGACLYLPAAHLMGDGAVRDLGGEIVRQALTYRQGRWAGDDSTVEPAGTHARLAFAL